MKGFALKDGDLLIENGDIQIVTGAELKRQTVEMVLSTQKGEWTLNIDEGINYANIFGTAQQMPSKKSSEVSYTKEINAIKQNNDKLNEMLERRLDGEGQ